MAQQVMPCVIKHCYNFISKKELPLSQFVRYQHKCLSAISAAAEHETRNGKHFITSAPTFILRRSPTNVKLEWDIKPSACFNKIFFTNDKNEIR